MTIKTKAVLQQELDTANEQIAAYKLTISTYDEKLAALEAKLKSTESTSDRWYTGMGEARAKLAQIHCVLDAIEGAPKREVKTGQKDWEGKAVKVTLSIEARLTTCVQKLLLQGIAAGSRK